MHNFFFILKSAFILEVFEAFLLKNHKEEMKNILKLDDQLAHYSLEIK